MAAILNDIADVFAPIQDGSTEGNAALEGARCGEGSGQSADAGRQPGATPASGRSCRAISGAIVCFDEAHEISAHQERLGQGYKPLGCTALPAGNWAGTTRPSRTSRSALPCPDEAGFLIGQVSASNWHLCIWSWAALGLEVIRRLSHSIARRSPVHTLDLSVCVSGLQERSTGWQRRSSEQPVDVDQLVRVDNFASLKVGSCGCCTPAA